MIAPLPRGLGFPTGYAQSAYYPGDLRISKEEVTGISQIIDARGMDPENTRLKKFMLESGATHDILQSSMEVDNEPQKLTTSSKLVRVVRGDHLNELGRIYRYLEKSREFAANPAQEAFIS
jgi:dipeptidyl-peptidase III